MDLQEPKSTLNPYALLKALRSTGTKYRARASSLSATPLIARITNRQPKPSPPSHPVRRIHGYKPLVKPTVAVSISLPTTAILTSHTEVSCVKSLLSNLKKASSDNRMSDTDMSEAPAPLNHGPAARPSRGLFGSFLDHFANVWQTAKTPAAPQTPNNGEELEIGMTEDDSVDIPVNIHEDPSFQHHAVDQSMEITDLSEEDLAGQDPLGFQHGIDTDVDMTEDFYYTSTVLEPIAEETSEEDDDTCFYPRIPFLERHSSGKEPEFDNYVDLNTTKLSSHEEPRTSNPKGKGKAVDQETTSPPTSYTPSSVSFEEALSFPGGWSGTDEALIPRPLTIKKRPPPPSPGTMHTPTKSHFSGRKITPHTVMHIDENTTPTSSLKRANEFDSPPRRFHNGSPYSSPQAFQSPKTPRTMTPINSRRSPLKNPPKSKTPLTPSSRETAPSKLLRKALCPFKQDIFGIGKHEFQFRSPPPMDLQPKSGQLSPRPNTVLKQLEILEDSAKSLFKDPTAARPMTPVRDLTDISGPSDTPTQNLITPQDESDTIRQLKQLGLDRQRVGLLTPSARRAERLAQLKAKRAEAERHDVAELLATLKKEQGITEAEARKAPITRIKVEDYIKPLSIEWNGRFDSIFEMSPTSSIAKTITGGELTAHDFATVLGEREWLNDEIINAYIDWVVDSANKSAGITEKWTQPKFVAQTSFFFSKLVKDGPASVVPRWMRRKRVDGAKLLDVERVFIPVNSGAHWTLGVVSPIERKIEYLDSFGGSAAHFVAVVKGWLQAELKDLFHDEEWVVADTKSAKQYNGYDCGVFTITNCQCIAEGVDTLSYSANDMAMQRRRIAAVLLNGGFRDEFARN